jgi:integrase
LHCRIPVLDLESNKVIDRWSTGITSQSNKRQALEAGKVLVGKLNLRKAAGLPVLRPWVEGGQMLFERPKVSGEHNPLFKTSAERYMQAIGRSKTKGVAWHVGYIVGMWGDLRDSEINYHLLSTYASESMMEEYSNSHIRSLVSYTKLILKHANLFEPHDSEYWLEVNPMAGVTFRDLKIGPGNIRRNPFTEQEFEEIYAYMLKRGDTHIANLFLCGWEGGHRPDENANLRWGMKSENTPESWKGATKRVFNVPAEITKKKHDTTTRLTDRLYEAIKYRLHGPDDLVFPNPDGELWTAGRWEDYWEGHVRKDLPHVKDHVFRDTRAGFATYMTENKGIDAHVVMRLMGLEKFDNFQRYFKPNADHDFQIAQEVESKSTLKAQMG